MEEADQRLKHGSQTNRIVEFVRVQEKPVRLGEIRDGVPDLDIRSLHGAVHSCWKLGYIARRGPRLRYEYFIPKSQPEQLPLPLIAVSTPSMTVSSMNVMQAKKLYDELKAIFG